MAINGVPAYGPMETNAGKFCFAAGTKHMKYSHVMRSNISFIISFLLFITHIQITPQNQTKGTSKEQSIGMVSSTYRIHFEYYQHQQYCYTTYEIVVMRSNNKFHHVFFSFITHIFQIQVTREQLLLHGTSTILIWGVKVLQRRIFQVILWMVCPKRLDPRSIKIPHPFQIISHENKLLTQFNVCIYYNSSLTLRIPNLWYVQNVWIINKIILFK